MSSPFTNEFFSDFVVVTNINRPLYLQLADFLYIGIKSGRLRPGYKLPSSRAASTMLSINRLTIARAYEELQIQGWLSSSIGKGTFVSSHIPAVMPVSLKSVGDSNTKNKKAGFSVVTKSYPNIVTNTEYTRLHLDDGYPDPRLAPFKEFYRAYRNELSRAGLYTKFGSYGDSAGPSLYRKALSDYLNETRGLHTSVENIMSIRGTLMGINLVCTSLIAAGDVVVSGIPGGHVQSTILYRLAQNISVSVWMNMG